MVPFDDQLRLRWAAMDRDRYARQWRGHRRAARIERVFLILYIVIALWYILSAFFNEPYYAILALVWIGLAVMMWFSLKKYHRLMDDAEKNRVDAQATVEMILEQYPELRSEDQKDPFEAA